MINRKYTLAHLIKSLQYLQHDLPVVLSQSELPTIFTIKYGTKISLEIQDVDNKKPKTVGELRDLARDFAKTRLKDEKCFLRKSVHIFREENGRMTDFVIRSLELVIGQNKQGEDKGYIYLVLNEA
jgi:hypothetical protein